MSPRSNWKTSNWSAVNLKKHVTWMSCKLEPAIWPRDTGQRIPCFDRCQLIVVLMSNINEVQSKPRLYVSVNLFWSMAAMLRDSVAAVVVRTRPRAIPLAMITMRKSTPGFPFLSHDKYGAPLGGPSGRRSSAIKR